LHDHNAGYDNAHASDGNRAHLLAKDQPTTNGGANGSEG
jgi:hypothetical protein